MAYRSRVFKLNLRPWKLLLLAIAFIIVYYVMYWNGMDASAIIMVPWFLSITLLLDAIVSKLRDRKVKPEVTPPAES